MTSVAGRSASGTSRHRRPRVLVVGSQWPPQTFLARLFDGLAERFDISIATRSSFAGGKLERIALPSESWPRPLRAGATAFYGAPALTRATGRRLAALDGWRRLPFLRRPVDLLYFPWNSAAIDHLPLMRLGIASIVSCRGTQVHVAPHQPERRAQTAGLRPSFSLATRVHCVSRAILECAREQGLDADKARVIYPAVDTSIFKPASIPPAPPSPGQPWRLICVGSLIWLKGFEDALLALRGLRDRGHDVRLDLAGDGHDRQRLRFAIHDLGLEDHVTMHGQLAPRRVLELIQHAHIFLLPSFSEGMANVALEAMACGVPVVSTRCGGMEEAITDGEHGLLVPIQDPLSLEIAILRLLEQDDLRQRLGAAARRRTVEDFRLEQQVDRFAELISEAIHLNI